ncbi:MAG TPA: hypothetical protein VJ810_29915 [Blastocatellia bacterium]|nr:hypothetical protein [Blastocatellia bacterium]
MEILVSSVKWTYGHLATLQNAEGEYKAAAEKFNAEAKVVSQDNVKIAEAAKAIAEQTTKAEKLRNDTAYQTRKAAEAGVRISARTSTPGVAAPALTTSPIELEKPKAPKESSTDFLTAWDAWIRLTNFGEILLAVVTLIYIRNRTAATNARPVYREEYFPPELDIEKRSPARRERMEIAPANSTKKKETGKKHVSFDSAKYTGGAQALRDVLKDISFRLKGYSFKVTLKNDCVWIVMVRANQGTQETVSSMRAKLPILSDVLTMPRDEFRARLERMLKQNGFEI